MAAKASHYHHGNLRRTLLDTALATIERSGLGALSLREVARQAGVTHAAPYRHFRDREALVVAIGIEGFEGLGAELARAAAGLADPVARFRALGVAYARYAVAHPAHFKVMFSGELHRSGETPELRAAGEPTLASLVAAIAEAQAAGAFPGGDPRALALPAWSMVHGLSMLLVDGQLPALLEDDQPGVESLANAVADVLLRGLSAKAGAPAKPGPSAKPEKADASGRPSRARPRRRS